MITNYDDDCTSNDADSICSSVDFDMFDLPSNTVYLLCQDAQLLHIFSSEKIARIYLDNYLSVLLFSYMCNSTSSSYSVENDAIFEKNKNHVFGHKRLVTYLTLEVCGLD